MSESGSARKGKAAHKGSIADGLTGYILGAINDADEQAAAERVAALRERYPDASSAELVELLIKQKCLQTGAVGAVTSGAAMIPGLGTFASLTFGVAADIGMTFKMQAELVLEIAAAYQHTLSPAEKRNVVMLVTGISAGANQMLSKAGTEIAQKATERLVQKSVTKAIPVLGVGASAGTNIVSTHIIGRRAQAYFSLGPEAVGDWTESLRTITGLDERELITWLAETTERSWKLASDSVQDVAGAAILAGKSLGEVVIVRAGQVSASVTDAGRSVLEGAGTVAGAVVDLGKKAGAGIATGADKAGEAIAEAGRSVVEGMIGTGKEASAEVAAGAGKISAAIADTGKSVAAGADATKERISKALGALKRKAEQEEESDAEETG